MAMGSSALAVAPVAAEVWHGEVDVGDGALPIAMAGDGPPLVLLHGWTLDGRMWLPQVRDLAQDFLLVMPDRRGFGRSSAPPDLAKEAEDILAIADFLGFERFSLLGLSQGAAVALDFAHKHAWRVSSLIVAGAPIPSLVAREEELNLDRFVELARAGALADLRREWLAHPLMRCTSTEGRALVEHIVADYQGRDLRHPSELPGITRDVLERMPMPVLSMTGRRDSAWRRECAHALAECVPQGIFELIESAGHLSNLEQPFAFNQLVQAFLSKALRTAS